MVWHEIFPAPKQGVGRGAEIRTFQLKSRFFSFEW